MQNNELYHHGVKGQKWGVRRYQNKNGSLTSLGKKRRGQSNDSLASRAAKKIKGSVQTSLANRKARKEAEAEEKRVAKEEHKKANKSIADMTETEMDERIRRLTKERQILSLEQQVNKFKPETKSRGERFIEYSKDIVASSVKEAGKDVLTKYLKKLGAEKLGLDQKSGLDKLKEKKEKLGLEKDIKQIAYDASQIGKKKENSLADQKLQTEIDKNKLAIEEAKRRLAKSKQDELETETDVAESKPDPKPETSSGGTGKKSDEPSTSTNVDTTSDSGKSKYSDILNQNINNAAKDTGKKAVESLLPALVNSSSSQNRSNTSVSKRDNDYEIDAETGSRIANVQSSPVRTIGQSYIAGLLEDKS